MSTNITFKGNAIFLFLGKHKLIPRPCCFCIAMRVDLWICFLSTKHHASSFVPKKSVVALGIEVIDKNKAILERVVKQKKL